MCLKDTFKEGKSRRHEARLDEAINEINLAEVVAIDLEFTGLFTQQIRQRTVPEYYSHCRANVSKFLAIQLGICTARRGPERNSWILSPFNINLFPHRKRIFSVDSSTLTWLLKQGFDLHSWVLDGMDFDRLANLSDPHAPTGTSSNPCEKSGAQRLIEAVIESQKPVVFHNGILDLLHLYDKFVETLPDTLQQFAANVRGHFSGGLYDTKRIAEEGRHTLFGICDTGPAATSLDSLRYHFMHKETSKLNMQINPELHNEVEAKSYSLHMHPWLKSASKAKRIRLSSDTSATPSSNTTQTTTNTTTSIHDKPHEAGYDAMCTLQLFLLQLEWIYKSQREAQKQPSKEDDDPPAAIPQDWSKLDLCVRASYCLEMVGIPPGKMDLNADDKRTTAMQMPEPFFGIPAGLTANANELSTASDTPAAAAAASSAHRSFRNLTMVFNPSPKRAPEAKKNSSSMNSTEY